MKQVKLLRNSKPSRYATANEIDYVQKSLKRAMEDLEKVETIVQARYQHVSRALSAFNNIVMRLGPDLIQKR
jgi:hypothetical protein